MKILIAEDESVTRRLLEQALRSWGYEVRVTCTGPEAWKALEEEEPVSLALLDWELPEMAGIEICRRARACPRLRFTYLILLTSRAGKDDVVAGLENGADDYIVKPFDREELGARLRAAGRIVELQKSLAARVAELEESLDQIKRLHGLLPICAWCKKIRDDQNYWQEVEHYFMSHTGAQFTHGICPGCMVRAKTELKR